MVGDIAYFPAFDGRVQPVAMTGNAALPMASWPLFGKGEEAWAPSGIGIDGEDDLGRIYFLMNAEANGVDGMHNAGAVRSGCSILRQGAAFSGFLSKPGSFVSGGPR